jgi:hypothetical protein
MSERKEPLILFEEEGWAIAQPQSILSIGLLGEVCLAHKHKNWRGKEKYHPSNYFDMGHFYSFGPNSPSKDWDWQCSKCGEEPSSEIKTRFNLLSD